MATFTKILAFNAASKSYNNVACDSNGALNVNVVSGGGSSAGDASAENQLTQIEVAQASNIALYDQIEVQTDRLIYDLDIIANRLNDISGTVEVSNQITGYATSQLQTDSNLAVCSRLTTIATAAEDTLLSVDGINTKLNALQLQQAKYTIEAASRLAPDTTPQYTVPPAGIEKSEGWYFKNTATGQPSQLYFYSYLNSSLQVPARQFAYEIGSISMSYCVVRLLNINSGTGLVTMAIYSRPTGSGDSVPGFYKSRKVYTVPTGSKLTQGMRVMLWWGTEQPHLKLHPDVARIQLQLSTTTGPALPTEQLAFLSLQTDSTALAGNAEYVVSAAGFQYGSELIMDSIFTGESSVKAPSSDSTAANQVLQLNAANNSNLALSTRLDSSNTAVCSRLDTNNNELTILNSTMIDLINGDSQLYVALSGGDDSVSIYGYNQVLDMPQSITLTTSSGIRALDVNVANQPSGYATEYTLGVLNDLVLAQSANNKFQVEVAELTKCNTDSVVIDSSNPVNVLGSAQVHNTLNNAYLTVDAQQNLRVYLDNQISGFATETTLSSLNGKVTKCDTDDVTISNQISGFATETTLSSLNGKVTKCDTDNVIIPGSVDTHLYAEHNSTWLSVKSAASGHLLVNSSTQDGAGTSITSTAVSAKQGLDVNVINTVPVSGSVSVSNLPAIQTVTGTISVTGSSVAVSNFPPTQAVSGTVSVTGSSVSVSNFPATQPVSGSVSVSGTVSSRLLDGAGTAITSTLINSKQGVDVNIANNSTTNDYSRVGLNTYQITPIRKTYQLNGMNNNNVVGIAGGQNTIVDYRTFTFGVAGLAYPIYFNSTNTTRTLIYDYVNSSGNLVENATLTLTANSWIATPNILGVNKWTVTPQFAFNSADVVFMSVTQASTGSIGSKSVSSYMNGIITIPNGYIGYVTNIVSFVSATNNVVLQIWDTNGTRTDAIEFPNTGYYQYSAPYFGGFSGVLTAGMACAFGFENTGTSRNVYCTVILEAI